MEGVSTFILSHEPAVRLAAFAGIIAVMAGWEVLAPRRPRSIGRRKRWPVNLGIAALNTVILRVVFPTAAVGMAVLAEARGWGVLNAVALPEWTSGLIAVVVLDLSLYVQHVVFHKAPLLWRLHRLHHADVDVDLTTGARFHPLEIVLSMAFKMALVAALGAPAVTVVIFEVLLNANAIFNHANVRMPEGVERILRLLFVTPDMHRVHHSALREETDSNYGFQLAFWDRLFGTYRDQPALGHRSMELGTTAEGTGGRLAGKQWLFGISALMFWSMLTNTAHAQRAGGNAVTSAADAFGINTGYESSAFTIRIMRVASVRSRPATSASRDFISTFKAPSVRVSTKAQQCAWASRLSPIHSQPRPASLILRSSSPPLRPL